MLHEVREGGAIHTRMGSLSIASVQIRGFRNLAHTDLSFGERFNVIAGDNGQGKTNLLEALYVLATSRSFRTPRPADVVAFGEEIASVRGVVDEEGDRRVQAVGSKAGSRVVRLDDKRPATLAAYAVRTPIVVFHPGEITLSMGSSAERRKLLDRTALYVSPSSMIELDSYGKAIKSRQKTLETRGIRASELGDWEALAARHGAAVMRHRAEAAEPLSRQARIAFEQIAAPGLSLSVTYAPSAPIDENAFATELQERRPADLRRGSANIGPHRDDLALAIDGHGVRGFASQGQHRAITLALKSAEIDVVGGARGIRPILLLDDVSSELDRSRTSALFSFLREQQGQVFLTTTRPELIDTGDTLRDTRKDFSVERGTLRNMPIL